MVTNRFVTTQENSFTVRNMKTCIYTVLYVEDNPANLLLVTQLISRRQDTKLLSAISGDLGILIAKTYQPSVILMDINLPGMNGFDALAILRDDPATSHIPVIALSSNAFPKDIENGLKAGFFRYLTKPYLVTEFADALELAFYQIEKIRKNGLRSR
jgi:CheY-like chemotaxis protein